jgi:hypothetical protein
VLGGIGESRFRLTIRMKQRQAGILLMLSGLSSLPVSEAFQPRQGGSATRKPPEPAGWKARHTSSGESLERRRAGLPRGA